MSIENLFKALKDEAGPGGAVIVFVASPKKGEDIQVLCGGPPEQVSWLLNMGVRSLQLDYSNRVSHLVTGEWEMLSRLRHLDLEGSPWDVIPQSRKH